MSHKKPKTRTTYRRIPKTKGPTQADKADRHILYERAVQCVESEIDMVDETYETLRGRKAITLREDFCGTANTSCEWVRRRKNNQAWGVDLDTEVLAWGKNNKVNTLNGDGADRIVLMNENVLTVKTPPVDMILAMNFSYWIFRTRDQMREYFSRVYASLASDGLFFLDAYGGPEAYEEQREKTKYDGFTYIWDQAEFEPVTGRAVCHIHFKFPDGSRIKKAFSYEWRIWTLPELREILEEAGFKKVRVYWEDEDDDGEGTGEFSEDDTGEADLAWISYLVAEK